MKDSTLTKMEEVRKEMIEYIFSVVACYKDYELACSVEVEELDFESSIGIFSIHYVESEEGSYVIAHNGISNHYVADEVYDFDPDEYNDDWVYGHICDEDVDISSLDNQVLSDLYVTVKKQQESEEWENPAAFVGVSDWAHSVGENIMSRYVKLMNTKEEKRKWEK